MTPLKRKAGGFLWPRKDEKVLKDSNKLPGGYYFVINPDKG